MPNTPFNQSLHWFRQASPYINAHRGRTFVIYLDGQALQPPWLDELAADLALLSSLGVRLVLVFDGLTQLAQQLQSDAQPLTYYQQRPVVTPAIHEVWLCQINRLRTEIEARLSMALPSNPLQGSPTRVISGNLVTARPKGIHEGQDLHFCGEIRRVQTQAIRQLLDQGHVVLLPPLGYSITGEVFDLEAPQLAMQVATQLQADKLLLLGEDEGVKSPDGEVIRDLMPREAEQWLHSLNPQSPLFRHLQAACQACQQGVARAHLLSFNRSGALLQELYTRDGDGTLITQQRYETLRKARIEDVGGLLALLRPLEESGVLVRRSRERLESEIERFTVIDLDGSIIACAALYPYPDPTQAELACVVVDPDYRHGQRGDRLLNAIQKQALASGVQALFVLTTQTAHWFAERGFEPAQVEQLPQARQALYNWQRNSRVFRKAL